METLHVNIMLHQNPKSLLTPNVQSALKQLDENNQSYGHWHRHCMLYK